MGTCKSCRFDWSAPQTMHYRYCPIDGNPLSPDAPPVYCCSEKKRAAETAIARAEGILCLDCEEPVKIGLYCIRHYPIPG